MPHNDMRSKYEFPDVVMRVQESLGYKIGGKRYIMMLCYNLKLMDKLDTILCTCT